MPHWFFFLLLACGDKAADCPEGLGMNEEGVCLESAETDCDDGSDGDADGLIDCEDEDCLEDCLEDCGDGKDNDDDGRSDCEDDECYGREDCGGPYTLSMATTFSPFPGYNYPIYFGWGEGLRDGAGQDAILSATGSVEVVAVPTGWGGDGFSCQADLYLTAYGSLSLGNIGMSYRGGSDGIVDYSFALTPAPNDGSLTWQGSCPISALPPSAWGFTVGGNTIARERSDGSWTTLYGANVTSTFYYTDVTVMGLGYITQYEPVVWDGVY